MPKLMKRARDFYCKYLVLNQIHLLNFMISISIQKKWRVTRRLDVCEVLALKLSDLLTFTYKITKAFSFHM